MISAKVLARTVEKFAVDNAPIILTGIGAAGVLATTFLTAKASFKSADDIIEEKQRLFHTDPNFGQEDDIPIKHKIKLVWKNYIPAASALGITLTCVVCAHRVSAKRIAAMAAAYSLSEKAYGEYREKVLEKFNANKERQIRDEIAQDHVNQNPPKDNQIIITGNGDVLCHDLPTGRYFKSNMEKLRSVQNDINAEVVEMGHSPLSFLYQALGLKPTPYSDELGWTTSKLLELHFSAVLTDDNQPCISIDYSVEPIRGATGAGFPRGCDEDPPF